MFLQLYRNPAIASLRGRRANFRSQWVSCVFLFLAQSAAVSDVVLVVVVPAAAVGGAAVEEAVALRKTT